MNTNWKDKTCENCVYRYGRGCRRFPPVYLKTSDGETYTRYVRIADSYGVFVKSCAEYNESE